MEEVTRAPLAESAAEPSEPRPSSALEMAFHRWDAEHASGEAAPIDPRLACDGVGEFFEVALPGLLKHRGMKAGTGQTIHLHRTDGDGEWMITLADLPVVTHEHGKGDAAVRGTASELILWLWGRIDPPEVFGDPSILDHLRGISAR